MNGAARGFAADRRGVSATVGVALITGLVVVGTVAVVTLGATAINDSQQTANVERAEHAMTQLDSKAAVVALGESVSKSVDLGRGGDGTVAVDENAGWIRVEHVNHNGADDPASYENETIYNGTMGAVTHTVGDTTLAYQGGGVWRAEGDGSRMVSPPEFHYRGATLTLPAILVRGDDAVSGSADARVTEAARTTRIHPNASETYDGSSRTYANPLENGTVRVTVHSDYYEAWGEFFERRTEGNVSYDDGAEEVALELTTVDEGGEFRFPDSGSGETVSGLTEPDDLDSFDIELRKGGGTFNNFQYVSLYARGEEGDFEVILSVPSGIGNDCSLDDSDHFTVDIYYREAGADRNHQWTNDSITGGSGDIRMECQGGDQVLIADFSGDTPMTKGPGNLRGETTLDWSGDRADPVTIENEAGSETDFTDGDRTTSGNLVRQYLAGIGPVYEMNVEYPSRGNNQIDNDASVLTIEYDPTGTGEYVTYVHVTENEIRVELA